jgi:hypothetical protein
MQLLACVELLVRGEGSGGDARALAAQIFDWSRDGSARARPALHAFGAALSSSSFGAPQLIASAMGRDSLAWLERAERAAIAADVSKPAGAVGSAPTAEEVASWARAQPVDHRSEFGVSSQHGPFQATPATATTTRVRAYTLINRFLARAVGWLRVETRRAYTARHCTPRAGGWTSGLAGRVRYESQPERAALPHLQACSCKHSRAASSARCCPSCAILLSGYFRANP